MFFIAYKIWLIFSQDNIPADRIKVIREKYLSRPELQIGVMRKISTGAVGLCEWVMAVEAHDR